MAVTRAASLTVIIGIILSGALYVEWGALSMSFLSISVLGLVSLYKIKQSHQQASTRAMNLGLGGSKVRAASSSRTVVDEPARESSSSSRAVWDAETSFTIPPAAKTLIEDHIETIRSGTSNGVIQIISTKSTSLVFRVKGYDYYFKTNSASGSPKQAKRRFQAKNRARNLVRMLELGKMIAIPRAELFHIHDMNIIGVEALTAEGSGTEHVERMQIDSLTRASADQIFGITRFVIHMRYPDIKAGNLLKLAERVHGVPFGFIDFDDVPEEDSLKSPIAWVIQALFGPQRDLREGLIATFAPREDQKNRVLKIVIRVLHEDNMLQGVISDLLGTDLHTRILSLAREMGYIKSEEEEIAALLAEDS